MQVITAKHTKNHIKEGTYLDEQLKIEAKNQDNSYAIPLNFLFKNRKKANLLHLYCYLRKFSKNNSGYVPKSILDSLSNHKRYILIPKLRKLGWMTLNKLNSVYTISKEGQNYDNICVNVDYQYLTTQKRLKQFIFACTEKYILRGKYISEKKGILVPVRDSHHLERKHVIRADAFSTKAVSSFSAQKSGKSSRLNQQILTSLVARSMFEFWGYSEKEVSMLRRGKINSYEYGFKQTHPTFDTKCYFSKPSGSYIKKLPTRVSTNPNVDLYRVYSESPTIQCTNINNISSIASGSPY